MSAEPPRLRCLSFHSVKGGVGKSTLALLCARELARSTPVVLVDMDLTGTSLADVLPLLPPKAAKRAGKLVLTRPTPERWPRAEARALIEERGRAADPTCRGVPFLNDSFLERSDAARTSVDRDVDPWALAWSLEDVPHLHVLPSSALPSDLERILPLIYDDLYAGFLESRLEWILARLLADRRDLTVIFDSPPTIPGLSAALLSLAMRLPERIPLATDVGWGGTPAPLRDASTTWTPVLVTSADLQDLRATDRWLQRVPSHERDRVRIVLNRGHITDAASLATERRRELQKEDNSGLSGLDQFGVDDTYSGVVLSPERVAHHLFVVPDDTALRLFRQDQPGLPTTPPDLLRLLTEDRHAWLHPKLPPQVG